VNPRRFNVNLRRFNVNLRRFPVNLRRSNVNLRRFNRIESKKIQCESKRDSMSIESKEIQCESKSGQLYLGEIYSTNTKGDQGHLNPHSLPDLCLNLVKMRIGEERRTRESRENSDSMCNESKKIQCESKKRQCTLNLRRFNLNLRRFNVH